MIKKLNIGDATARVAHHASRALIANEKIDYLVGPGYKGYRCGGEKNFRKLRKRQQTLKKESILNTNDNRINFNYSFNFKLRQIS